MTLPQREIPRSKIPERTLPTRSTAQQVASQIYEPQRSLVGNLFTSVRKAAKTIVITNKEVFGILLALLVMGVLFFVYFKLLG